MKKVTNFQLFKYGAIASLPFGIPTIFDMWSGFIIPHLPVAIRLAIFVGFLFFMIFVIKKAIRAEIKDYEMQLKNKFVASTGNNAMGWGFLGYIPSAFGSLIMVAFLCEKFKFDPWNEPYTGGLIPGILSVFVICGIVSLNIRWTMFPQNYTGYKLISIPLSEFEILGSGSKKFIFSVSAIIYGDENSPENLKIVDQNLDEQLQKFKDQLVATKQSYAEEQNQIFVKIENDFSNDIYKNLKLNLTALKT